MLNKNPLLIGRIYEKGLTMEETADAIGLTKAAFSYKINGKSDAGWKQSEVKKLCKVLDINIDDIGKFFYAQ